MINPEIKKARKRTWKIHQLERDTQLRSNNKDKMLIIGGTFEYKDYLFDYDDFEIYYVDGEWVRNNLYAWYRIGGHGRVHLFIPDNEIWIERNHGTVRYMSRTIIHEIAEFKAMKVLPFYHAHLSALAEELRNKSRLTKVTTLLRRALKS